ncbi:hypothetical protein ISCGN_004666 [Ixodes scapularis]
MFAHAGPRDWSAAVKRWSHAQPQFGTTGRSNGTIQLKPSVLSQLLWSRSSWLGCAWENCTSVIGTNIYVCNYFPRLRTGCAFTAKALHRINSAVDPLCPTCNVPEDFDHLLWDCTALTKERRFLIDGLQCAGVAHATTEEILFPPGPAGTASKTFARLLTFLEDTELFDRL